MFVFEQNITLLLAVRDANNDTIKIKIMYNNKGNDTVIV